jgi:hypothetical protein
MFNLIKMFDIYPLILICIICAVMVSITRNKKFNLDMTQDKNILNTLVFLFTIFVLGVFFCSTIKDNFESCCPPNGITPINAPECDESKIAKDGEKCGQMTNDGKARCMNQIGVAFSCT